ncbi:MAG: sigma-54 dependent transcriptional regulator [candidate division WOR-3 bacterium]|nr:sigma-54 dependent transcriptional regulator [candidate division WOR-3 bacterium]
MADILIVEDKASFAEVLKIALEDAGFTTIIAGTGREAIQIFKREKINLVILDLRLPDIDGIDVLRELKNIDTDAKFIIMTAFGTIERAVEAMKLGACDFLTKPFDTQQLITSVKNIIQEQKAYYENILLKEMVSNIHGFPEIVGKSEAIKKPIELLKKVAPTETTVLLLGESGTGKELFARACHSLSPRKDNPFVTINCAAIPSELLENELFGSEKGAFTGAVSRKIGKFELAHQGTIFLDEVGDLGLDLQAKLLRVIQEKTFERLGGTVSIKVDVRIIAASNKDLNNLVNEKKFREDLYYRLSVFPITIPPLRERKEDIPLLVEHFLKKLKSNKKISDSALQKLKEYEWPGNVRELENTIERANILAQDIINPEHILLPVRTKRQPVSEIENMDLKTASRYGREWAEAELIKRTLEKTEWNKAEAARRLRVSYKTLLNRIARYKQKGLI